jgi:hypothetical protein
MAPPFARIDTRIRSQTGAEVPSSAHFAYIKMLSVLCVTGRQEESNQLAKWELVKHTYGRSHHGTPGPVSNHQLAAIFLRGATDNPHSALQPVSYNTSRE